MGAYAFNPSIREAVAADLCESEANLVYRANSRTARATQRNPVLEKKKKDNRNFNNFSNDTQ